MSKGKVKHVLFDAKNPKHLKAVKSFNEKSEFVAPVDARNDKVILQFFEGKLSGYMNVFVEKGAIDINHIYIKPEFRDTVKLSEKAKKEAEEKWKKKVDNLIDNFGGKRSNLSREERKEFDLIEKRKSGRVKAEKQKLLGAKMLRWTAKTYGLPLETAFARSTAGRKHIDRYLYKYNKEFFNRRGAQKSRVRRKK